MRIRTIKPDFFIDEDLQDLEEASPGSYVMLVFAGLWGNCDKQGVFEWKARTLKLHILPFLRFEMEETLGILLRAGFITRFEADGKTFGYVPTFGKHQRINGKEAQESARYPSPPSDFSTEKPSRKDGEASGKQPGNKEEAVETTGREGKGREEEGKGKPAKEQSQSVPTGAVLVVSDNKQAGGLTERLLRECVEENRGMLREKFPEVDIDLEVEEMVAKYRRESIGADPLLLVIRWFKKLKNAARASPAEPGVSLAEQVQESNRQAARDFCGVGVTDG